MILDERAGPMWYIRPDPEGKSVVASRIDPHASIWYISGPRGGPYTSVLVSLLL